MNTPRTDAFIESFDWHKQSDYDAYVGMMGLSRQLETELAAMTALADRLAEALEASDECLALIEDVGHGANMNNVSVVRGYVQEALAAPAYFARRLFPITSLTPAN